MRSVEAHLGEPNGCRLFSETLTAQIKSIFADETRLVGTEPARKENETKGVEYFAICAYH